MNEVLDPRVVAFDEDGNLICGQDVLQEIIDTGIPRVVQIMYNVPKSQVARIRAQGERKAL